MRGDATVRVMTDTPNAQPTSFSRMSLAIMAHQSEANLLGNVHGGEIMKLADSTAGAVAHRHSGGPAVTAAMDQMTFLQPVHVGDIIRTYGQVNWAGTSSMEIGVRVEAQPWGNAADEPIHVASAYFVFVAIDESGKPREIPKIVTESADDVRREREAQIRRSHRLARKMEIEQGREG